MFEGLRGLFEPACTHLRNIFGAKSRHLRAILGRLRSRPKNSEEVPKMSQRWVEHGCNKDQEISKRAQIILKEVLFYLKNKRRNCHILSAAAVTDILDGGAANRNTDARIKQI